MTEPNLGDIRSTGYGDREMLLEQEQQTPETAGYIGPDDVPNLSDPSARPNEPVTNGLPVGDGEGPEALNAFAPDPVRQTLQAMLLTQPNNDVQRLIDLMDALGR